MIDLGSELREAREGQGITLTEAEASTRIKERYLRALEVNDWAALPTPVQARGFLRNYATFLGLDEDAVISRFGQATRSASVSLPMSPATETAVPTTGEDASVFRPRDIDIDSIGGMPDWFSSDVLLGVLLALAVAVVGFVILGLVSRGSGEEIETGTATSPAAVPGLVTGVPEQSEDFIPEQTGGGAGTVPAITPTFDASTGAVQLNLEATEHVWVRVTVDGAQVMEGILEPASPQTWQASQQIVLETANAAGLTAEVNGQPQGALGERGQAVVLIWGPNGQLLSTPASAP
jgi:cytoskeleton protein RodZ